MNRTIAICSLLAWSAIWSAVVICAPWIFSDKNKFFEGFVNEQFLSFMGVIVTITLASAANLFIEMNKLEDKVDKPVFRKAKDGVKDSSYWLIALLIFSIVVVIVKPLVNTGERSQAIVNGAAITIIIMSVLILIDLTQSAFTLDPRQD
ncbi:hypothetical protein [Asticcacaulis excentricus]|uniref:hypothetical protein n=1 Tax=Asticcacaulis excentricus TaxID=78587 RepID=UPI000F84D3E6|nr:hypothetical protein [Asticcacaulis excentricus]